MDSKGLSFKYLDAELAALRKYDDTKSAKFNQRNNNERWNLHGTYWKGFKFKNLRLHKLHWTFLNYYYRAYRLSRTILKVN